MHAHGHIRVGITRGTDIQARLANRPAGKQNLAGLDIQALAVGSVRAVHDIDRPGAGRVGIARVLYHTQVALQIGFQAERLDAHVIAQDHVHIGCDRPCHGIGGLVLVRDDDLIGRYGRHPTFWQILGRDCGLGNRDRAGDRHLVRGDRHVQIGADISRGIGNIGHLEAIAGDRQLDCLPAFLQPDLAVGRQRAATGGRPCGDTNRIAPAIGRQRHVGEREPRGDQYDLRGVQAGAPQHVGLGHGAGKRQIGCQTALEAIHLGRQIGQNPQRLVQAQASIQAVLGQRRRAFGDRNPGLQPVIAGKRQIHAGIHPVVGHIGHDGPGLHDQGFDRLARGRGHGHVAGGGRQISLNGRRPAGRNSSIHRARNRTGYRQTLREIRFGIVVVEVRQIDLGDTGLGIVAARDAQPGIARGQTGIVDRLCLGRYRTAGLAGQRPGGQIPVAGGQPIERETLLVGLLVERAVQSQIGRGDIAVEIQRQIMPRRRTVEIERHATDILATGVDAIDGQIHP